MSRRRFCRCPGYEQILHDYDGTSGTCLEPPTHEFQLCGNCDGARRKMIADVLLKLTELSALLRRLTLGDDE